ncbi:hypothetical protein RHSIM_Rhsim09G0136600 [Rhododendron simsii]|uniref:Uncharacterized protein n=1 Tax=Rhododendron simsii TaxID=118357 RepID=A0A834LDR5_RHOSS|nr:hypothetical protein RHSIM_Rhsim09G0136600 [Rhododendron simsii]
MDERVSLLYSAWSGLLDESMKGKGELLQGVRYNVPKAPHLENCKLSAQINKNFDKHVENESFPPWTLWKGFLDTYPSSTASEQLKSEGVYPPWVCSPLPDEVSDREVREEPESDMEQFVWSNHKPWMPRPLLSIHLLCSTSHSTIFLQEVIDRLRSYPPLEILLHKRDTADGEHFNGCLHSQSRQGNQHELPSGEFLDGCRIRLLHRSLGFHLVLSYRRNEEHERKSHGRLLKCQ